MKTSVLYFLFTSALLFGAEAALQKAEFKFKLRGYIQAGSKKSEGLGGNASSNNMPKVAPEEFLRKKEVHMRFTATAAVPFSGKYESMTLHLINGSDGEQSFSACDGRLSVVQQAQNAEGQWKDIEYLPSSFCGNSYHTVFLQPKEYWEFVVPRYSGPLKTKILFKLTQTKDRVIYSDSFDGSIHPEQFTVEQGHAPSDIMDPYTN